MALTKIRKLIEVIDDNRKPIAEKLIQELSFMDMTLAKLRKSIREIGPIMAGNTGPKQNPAMQAYNTTVQRYALLNKQLIHLLPAAAKPEAKDELAEFLKKGKAV